MTAKRLYFVLIGVISLLCFGLLFGAYGVNKLLVGRADTLTNLKAKNVALSQEQTSLIQSKKDIKTYAELDKIAKSVVPADKDQAEAVREIVNIAGANGVSLAAINFPASTLGSLGNGTAAASATTAPNPAISNPKAGALSQLQPVKTIPGIYQLTITVQGDPNQPVRYDKFISFLSALEHNRRTAQVSTITLQPNTDNRNFLAFTLTLNEYIKP